MFPQELVDKIVGEVVNNEDVKERRSNLQACALLSWCWHIPCRKILFQHIDLHEHLGSDNGSSQNQSRCKLEKLLDLLQHDPTLEAAVTSLSVQLSIHGVLDNQSVDNPSTQNGERAILPSILDSLHNIRSFSLVIHSFSGTANSWNSLGTPLQEAFLRFCTSRPITQINVGYVHDIPLTLVTQVPNVTSLSLLQLHLVESGPAYQPPSTLAKLKSLSIDSRSTFSFVVPQLMKEPQHPDIHFHLSDLQRLEISTRILTALKPLPSVRHLLIDGWSFDLAEAGPINPGILKGWRNLQVLEIHWQLNYPGGLFHHIPLISPAHSWNSNFASAAHSCSINTIIVMVSWCFLPPSFDETLDLFRPFAGWNRIDTFLSSPVVFPNLRAIELNFALKYAISDSDVQGVNKNDLRENIELPELLPSISASNLIQVKFDITVESMRLRQLEVEV